MTHSRPATPQTATWAAPCLLRGAMALACCTALTVAAQPLPLQQTVVRHAIAQGDTLTHIALRYLGDATLWPALQSHNRLASPYRLQPGTVLEVPLRLMPTSTATISYVQGQAQLLTRPSSTAEAAVAAVAAASITTGMPVHEGDQLQLSPDAFVAVRLADGSIIQVQSDAQVHMQQLRRRGRAGSLQSVIELQQGGVELQVPGTPDARRRLDVRTPVATTSVRGTQFGVQLHPNGAVSTAVLQGRVALQAQGHTPVPPHTLPARTGMAVDANGHSSPPTPLLPAPAAQQLPSLNENAQWLELPMPDWPQAQGWQVSVSRDPQGQQVLRNGRFTGSLARFAAIADGSYYLHARAIDAQGISGLPGTAVLRVKALPVPPLAQTPAPHGLLAHGAEAHVRCTPVPEAHHYRHQIIVRDHPLADATAADFAHAVLHTTSAGDDCRADASSLPPGHYAWRAASVRLLSGQEDQGPFSSPHPFQIVVRPAALALDSLQADTAAGITTIHWPAEPGQRFRLQALPTADSDTPALDTWLDTPRWSATGLPAGQWYVRIQVEDGSGLRSAFSPPRSVQVRDLLLDSSGQPVQSSNGAGIERQPL